MNHSYMTQELLYMRGVFYMRAVFSRIAQQLLSRAAIILCVCSGLRLQHAGTAHVL